jgi:PhzF family phenazine biosynthesis protein
MCCTFLHVDAFVDGPFTGNPAGVCLLETPKTTAWMQAVAAELCLSETSFLVPGGGAFGLRWFTPAVEVDLCGHGTLAAAHALWESGRLVQGAPAAFDTRSGRLTARRVADRIELDFPATPVTSGTAPTGLAAALGATPVFTGQSVHDWFVELASDEEVRRLAPDLMALKRLGKRGVIVTARDASGGYDFVSRFFAPAAGINEDPVTGSAHCCLGPYWAEKLGRTSLRAYQASPRGGVLLVDVRGERVALSGKACTVLRGELLI